MVFPPGSPTSDAAESSDDRPLVTPDPPTLLNESTNSEPSVTVDIRTIPIKDLLSRKRRKNGLKEMPSTIKRRQDRKKQRMSERSGNTEPTEDENEEEANKRDADPPSADDPTNTQPDVQIAPDVDDGDAESEDNQDADGVVAPQVRVGEDGNIIVDQASLVVSATLEPAEGDDHITTVEVPSSDAHITSASFSKRETGIKWSDKETDRFYEALHSFGTDFSLMQRVFTSRSRRMLKLKFKREERDNPERIEQALCSPRNAESCNLLTTIAETLPATQDPANQEGPVGSDASNDQNNTISGANQHEDTANDNDDGDNDNNDRQEQAEEVVGRASDEEQDAEGDGSPNIGLEHLADGSEFFGDDDDDDSSDG